MKAYIRLNISSSGGDNKGFTLIEVLIAMMVFSVGIMAVTAMTVQGFRGFETARSGTVEVFRNIRHIDTFRSALYDNDQIFDTNAGTPANYPLDNDRPDFKCWDFNDLVVRDVKFIAVENQQLKSSSASGFYRLFYNKPGKQQVK